MIFEKTVLLWFYGELDVIRFEEWMGTHHVYNMINYSRDRNLLKITINDEKAYMLFLMCFRKTKYFRKPSPNLNEPIYSFINSELK